MTAWSSFSWSSSLRRATRSWSSTSIFPGAVDVDLRLDNGYQPEPEDLLSDRELLRNDSVHPLPGKLDERAHFGAEHVLAYRTLEQVVQIREGLHDLSPVGFFRQALVNLEERHNVFDFPQIIPCRHSPDVAVHCVLEQNRPEDPVTVEAGAGNDARAHLMHQIKHLLLTGVGVLVDPIKFQRFRGTAPALIQRRDEAGTGPGLVVFSYVRETSFRLASCDHVVEPTVPRSQATVLVVVSRYGSSPVR